MRGEKNRGKSHNLPLSGLIETTVIWLEGRGFDSDPAWTSEFNDPSPRVSNKNRTNEPTMK